MKITNGECFVLENGLRLAASELKESKVKSLALNVVVARNLQKASELCESFRKEIRDFMPAELKVLNEKNELSEEDELKKKVLSEEYNTEINKFLSEPGEICFYKPKISLESLAEVELGYDSSSIVALILSDQ
jgi:hypothetical protein